MNILGISGLPKSVEYKKSLYPELESRIHRIVQGLDSAAALVNEEGIIAACAEERFNREKGTNSFPHNAIKFCLDKAAISLNKVDKIAHCFSYDQYEDFYVETKAGENYFNNVLSSSSLIQYFNKIDSSGIGSDIFHPVEHHLAHAASAYYPSGFSDSLIMVADGMGEAESLSMHIGNENGIQTIKKISALHSIGILYGLFTYYLGFEMNRDEYKVMGLASYGDSNVLSNKFKNFIVYDSNGGFTIPIMYKNTSFEEKDTHSGVLLALEEMFGPRRSPGGELTKLHMDIAASVQKLIEESLINTLLYFKNETGLNRLCMAGGVALNCVANGIIRKEKIFDNMYIQPASGDDGAALGAALYLREKSCTSVSVATFQLPLWGPEYTDQEIESCLPTSSEFEIKKFDSPLSIIPEVAKALNNGDIVSWFQGRSEFGPRALGCRSILANPAKNEMKEKINEVIKERESFRPFAPAVIDYEASNYFEVSKEESEQLSSMLFTVPVLAEAKEKIQAVTHVDGSARVQIVTEKTNPLFWNLIKAFGDLSGFPVLLNTSFNINEPIVNSPKEAIATFLRSKMEHLAIGSFLISRKTNN